MARVAARHRVGFAPCRPCRAYGVDDAAPTLWYAGCRASCFKGLGRYCGDDNSGSGRGRVVATYINRIGTAVPTFDVHNAFVEYASSLLASERARRLFGKMAERSQIEHRYSFLQPQL